MSRVIGNCIIRCQKQLQDILKSTTEIVGDLVLETDKPLDLSNLNNLSTITNRFIIDGTSLWDFEGLENLKIIGDDLIIKNNKVLNSLKGLHSLGKINGSIEISNNDNLNDLNALGNLCVFKGNLLVKYNARLAEKDAELLITFFKSLGWEGEHWAYLNKLA